MSIISRKIQTKQLDYSNLVYNIAYVLIVIKAFYAYSDLVAPHRTQLILNICNLLLLGLLMYKMVFLQRYSIKNVVLLGLLGLITFYTDRQVYMFMMLPDFLLIAATQDVDFRKTISIVYKLEAAIIGLHVAVYPLFYFFNRSAVRFSIRGSDVSRPRHQFLLSHANIFSMLLLWTILGYLYVNYEKLNKKKIILAWLTYVATYMFTKSNSGLLILSAITILLMAKNILGDKVDGLVDFLARYLYFILIIVFDLLMVSFSSLSGPARDIWFKIDDFFTGRPRYGAFAFYKAGFTLFGQHIPFSGKELWSGMWFDSAACDNAYMWMSVSYGLFYLLLIAFLFWRYAPKATFPEKIIFIAYSLYTMMELYVTYMYFCFAVIIVGQYIWDDINKVLIRNKKDNGRE